MNKKVLDDIKPIMDKWIRKYLEEIEIDLPSGDPQGLEPFITDTKEDESK